MLSLEHGLYLRVQELPDGPRPMPLKSGFNLDTAYRALGLFNPSETSDAYFIFANDRDEVWFICNRHLRVVGLRTDVLALRLPLGDFRPERTDGVGSELAHSTLRLAQLSAAT